jgi:hypothetical protein
MPLQCTACLPAPRPLFSRATYLSGMFAEAQAFNHSLCAWGPRLQGRSDSMLVDGMFANATSCPTMQDPTFGANLSGPFCYMCDQ